MDRQTTHDALGYFGLKAVRTSPCGDAASIHLAGPAAALRRDAATGAGFTCGWGHCTQPWEMLQKAPSERERNVPPRNRWRGWKNGHFLAAFVPQTQPRVGHLWGRGSSARVRTQLGVLGTGLVLPNPPRSTNAVAGWRGRILNKPFPWLFPPGTLVHSLR